MLNFFNFKKSDPDWSFQLTAISSLVKDFRSEPMGRFLLVLPTGGGKTLTAIRTLDALLKQNLFGENDKILWVVHTLALKSHAQKNLQKEEHYNGVKFSLNRTLKDVIEVKMKAEAIRELSGGSKYKFIVIDEAHHSAAETYREFFEYPIGILGLTATPRRMDLRGLPFKKISYSVTFRELVRRKVVLLPRFLPEVQTHIPIDVSSLDDENQLEKFNSQERNKLVSHHLFTEVKKHEFKKVIVFAGTNAHVKRLYEVIKTENESSGSPFGHIGYIYGGDNNDRGMKNEEYLEWHHTQKSSVLVNCKILNEGYDDPNIDTVVMATPTNSILYYLQCIGRVVRTPEDHSGAKAYVVEIVDKLPNVAYRIDNRWLFSEISDYLEPLILDIKGLWPLRPIKVFAKLLALKVRISDLSIGETFSLLIGRRINLLLFNDVPYNGRGEWRIMTISETDFARIQIFNDLSENIDEYHKLNHDYLLEKKYPEHLKCTPLNKRAYRSSLFAALRRASQLKSEKKKVDSIIYLSVI
jgi:superfamily II DNA or RNA helicase